MSLRPNVLGIDVGSVSVSVVALTPDKQIIQSAYEFHHGKPADKLREILSKFDLASVGGIASTASRPLPSPTPQSNWGCGCGTRCGRDEVQVNEPLLPLLKLHQLLGRIIVSNYD